jgi:hypothetical protein
MLEISVATYRRRFIDSFGILFASSGKMEARMAELAATWIWWGRQCKGLRLRAGCASQGDFAGALAHVQLPSGQN